MSKKKTDNKRTHVLVLGAGIYARPFLKHGEISLISPHIKPDRHEWRDIKLVVFTGGADVDPSLYSEKAHLKTHSDIDRDKLEQEYYHAAVKAKIPMVGICRGAQFLTVMNGGSLVQHVNNHAVQGTHPVFTNKGKEIKVTSTHHQMMYPKGKFKMLAWAKGLSNKYQTGRGTVTPKTLVDEPEVVWYNQTKSLAVQFHPEYMNDDSGGFKYFQELIKEYVL